MSLPGGEHASRLDDGPRLAFKLSPLCLNGSLMRPSASTLQHHPVRASAGVEDARAAHGRPAHSGNRSRRDESLNAR